LVAEAGSAAPAELLAPWATFLHEETKVRAESVIKKSLYDRLRNLLHRRHVERNGRSYSITTKGLEYLGAAVVEAAGGESQADLGARILQLQEQLRQEVRAGIAEMLGEMDPYAFEELIQRLLDAMGYQDTETTKPSGDGGVDVLGTIKVGISEIKEVVQVKRQQANVGRGVLDALRGSLYRFDAVQGTVITTSGFSQGARTVAFDRGAAPITLIDGDTLVGLLIEHGIGIEKRKIELWSLNPEAFVSLQDDE
jgi:restriction system protein